MFPPETRQSILDRISQGESLRSICSDEGFPSQVTVMRWLDDDPEFVSKYAHAREKQADLIFDDMAKIEADVIDGTLKSDAARVVLESRRWRAEKLKPKVYGRQSDLNVSGTISVRPLGWQVVDPAEASS